MNHVLTPVLTPSELGRWGEDIACAALELTGMSLVERNWRPPQELGPNRPRGEIDLLMRDTDQQLVFVEVKTRSSQGYGHPLEAITGQKSARLRSLAYTYLNTHRGRFKSYRFDAVAVSGRPGLFTLEHRAGVI